tara:strand:+ start:7690 stop:13344 length:5655 start_codon:yes stop_codon:yes gene_type:complete
MAQDKKGVVSADSGTTSKGLQTDVAPLMQPQGSYRFALNALNDSTDGAMGTLTNEPGNFECANFQGYTVIGSVYMENNETAVFAVNGNSSRIIIFNEEICGTTVMVTSSCLNFTTDSPIQAIYRKRKGCERVLYFTDDNNPIKAINLDSLEDYVVEGSTYTGPDSNWDCSQMNLFRDMLIPHFKYEVTNDGGGDLVSGTYSFACRYLDEDLNPTNFIAFTDPVPIYRDDLQAQSQSIFDVQGSPSDVRTTKSINWEITCDTRWDYVEVVAIPATGGDGNIDGDVYSVARLPIPNTSTAALPIGGANNGSVVDFVFRGVELSGVEKLDDGLDQITIDRNVYRTAKTLTQQANRLILGNVKENEIDHAAFQRAAMKIQSGYKVYTHPYEGGNGGNKALNGNLCSYEGGKHSKGGYFWATERSYMRDEVYAFGVVWVFNDGSETPVYHIPGREKDRFPQGQIIGSGGVPGRDPNHPVDGAFDASLRTEHNRMTSRQGVANTDRFDSAKYKQEDVYAMVEAYGEETNPDRRYEKWELVNTGIRRKFDIETIYPDGSKCFDPAGYFKIEGANSYWESKDFTYPDLKDCNGDNVYGSSAGKPIRHHKLPDTTLEPHFYGASDFLVKYNNKRGNSADYNPQDPTDDAHSYYSAPGEIDHVANIGFWFDNVQIPNIPNSGDIQGYRIVRVERTEADKSVIDKGLTFYNHRTATYSHGNANGDSGRSEYCNWMAGDRYCWFYFQGNQYNKNKSMWQVDTCLGDFDDEGGCGTGSGCDSNPYFVGAVSGEAKKPSMFVPSGCSTVGWPHTTTFASTPDDPDTDDLNGNKRPATTCISCNNSSSSCMPFVLDFFGIQSSSERRANGYPMSMFFLGTQGEDEFEAGGSTCSCGAFITGQRGAIDGDGASGGIDTNQMETGLEEGFYEMGNSEITLGCDCGGGLSEDIPVVVDDDEDDTSWLGGLLGSIVDGITSVINFVVDTVVSAVNFVADIVSNAFNSLFGFDGVAFGDCCGSVSYWWGNRNNSISYHGPKVKFGDRTIRATHIKFERILIGRPLKGKYTSRSGTAYLGDSMKNKYYEIYSPEKLKGDNGISDGGMVADIMDYNVGSRVPWFAISRGVSRGDTGLRVQDAPDVNTNAAVGTCTVTGPNFDAPLIQRKLDAGFHVGAGERVEGVFEVPFDNCKGLETYVLKIGDTGCSKRHGIPFPGNNGDLFYQRVPDDRTSAHRKDGCTPNGGDLNSDETAYAYYNREYCSTAYYIGMKRYNPSQYGDLSNIVYIKSSDGVMAPSARYEDFNGDIHISKMAFRQSSHMTKCAGRTTANASGNYSFLMTRSATWYFTESEINTDLRHGDGTRDEWYFPYSFMGSDLEGSEYIWENYLDAEGYRNLYAATAGVREKYIFTGTQFLDEYKMSELPPMKEQVYNYNYDYSRITKEKKYFPVALGTDFCSDCPQKYPHRIVYSQQSFQEENVDTYKAFLSGAYKEIPGNTGSINNLFTYNGTLMALTDESLWVLYKQNSQLQGGPEDLSVLVSRGEFLSDDPRQLLDSKTGYAGCDSQWSLQITEFGPLWIDSRRGKVYHLAGNTPTEISLNGLKNFFITNGRPLSLTGVGEQDPRHDNPILGYGYTTAYDPQFKRYIITKHDQYQGKDRSFTLSYSLLNKSWTSFHGYFPNHYMSGNKSFSGAVGNSAGFKFGIDLFVEPAMADGVSTQNYQTYFNEYGGDFIVDIILNNNPMMTSVSNDVMWATNAKIYDPGTNQFVDVDDTFTHGILYNSYQSSGKLNFVATNQSESSVLSSAVGTVWPQARVNRYERTYKLNEFRDMVSDNTQPIWSSSWADIGPQYFIDKVVNPAAVSGATPWSATPRFRDKYLGIRLFFSNFDGKVKLTNNFLISTKTISPR